jgi:hypothetical protein
MKKYLLIAGLALITAGGATAALLNNSDKKKTKKETKENCIQKKQCSKSYKTACL